MFWLIWQMGFFLLVAFAGGVFTGWMVWSSRARSAEADKALADAVQLRRENENLARRLGEAEAKIASQATTSPVVVAPKIEAPAKADEKTVVAKKKIEPAKVSVKATVKKIPKAKAPAKAKVPASDDDLLVIKGLGPKAAATLNEAGVTSYAQLASWTAKDIETWDTDLNGRGRIVRDDWVGQAKKLSI
jgi:predicted flap endonuclease-1-like 5' DNA nuclease